MTRKEKDMLTEATPIEAPNEALPAAPVATTAPAIAEPMTPAREAWELAQREARAWSTADVVPARYKGKIGDCIVALDTARRMGASPLMVMQHLYIVHGTPAWSATFQIAAVNSCKRFSALRYEERGTMGAKDYAVRAVATERASGEVLAGTWITAQMVDAEGWAKKSGSKWLTMPEQMYRYRAASFWARAYAPDLTMGLQTVEEVEDVAAPRVAPGTTTIRWSPRQMAEAKAEIAHGNATVDDIAERFPALATDQLDELRGVALNTEEQ